MAAEEELPDWLKPSMPEEEKPEWLQPTTVAEIPPPPTPDVPEDEPEDSYWSQFSKWASVTAVRTLLNLQDIKQADVGTAGRAVARAGVRSAEDLVNTVNDVTNALGVTPITERVNWEEEWLGKPENAVEEIAAEMGSWITAFAGPGGVVKAGLKTFSTTTKISSKADDVIKLIGKTPKGRKALTVGRIAGEGALKGAVADFITTDVDDVEAEEALYKRLTNTIEGAVIGAGFNLAVFPTAKYIGMYFRRAKALRAVKRASEGKGDATAALKQLKESLDEEAALKEETLTNIRPIDDRVDRITVDDERQLEAIREGREFDELFREVGGDPEDIPEVDLSTVNWDEVDIEEAVDVAPAVAREEMEAIEAGGRLIDERETATALVKTYEMPGGSKRTVMVDKANPERVSDKFNNYFDFAPKAAADLDTTYGQIGPALKKDFYDKTLVEQVSQRMQTGKPMTAREALQDLSDRTNGNLGEYSPIVKKLLALGKDTGIDARIEERAFASNIPEVASKIRGSFYDSEGRRIVLDAQTSSVKDNPVYNLLHESTHAVTVDNVSKHYDRNAFGNIAIDDVAGRAAFIDDVLKQKDLPKPIAEMFRMFKKADGMRDEIATKGKLVTTEGQPDLYWIKNPMEFMSMAFSDPQLQRALKGIQYTPKMTMWEKIVNTVKNLFGKGVSTDLADNIVSRVGEIAEMRLPTQRGRGVEGMPAAFHGTPHVFKPKPDSPFGAFEKSKIGTGEGAQAFGHGFYLAESENVSKFYYRKEIYKHFARDLEDAGVVLDPFYMDDPDFNFDTINQLIEKGVTEEGVKIEPRKIKFLKELRDEDWLGFDEPSQSILAAFDDVFNKTNNYDLPDSLKKATADLGRIYKVDIKPKNEEFLLWDKPIESMPSKIQQIIKGAVDGIRDFDKSFPEDVSSLTGKDFYKLLSRSSVIKNEEAASDFLSEMGIPGIRYLEGGKARKTGKGAHNYVVFSDKDLKVTGTVDFAPTGREARGVSRFAEDQIENYIDKGQDLPDQVNRLVRLNVELDKTMNPKINGLVERLSEFDVDLEKGITKDLRGQFEGIKGDVLNLEEDLIKYRKMIDLRAKAGNLSGKLLVSFKGKSKMNFRKPITYKPAVQKQFESIDRLLSLIDGIKSGELTNDNILQALKKELSNADELANTGDLRAIIDKEFGLTVDDAIDTIWGKYKERISNQVLKTLRLNKGTNKAALDMFSQRLTKNLTDAVQVSKPIVKKVNQTLDNLQDILNNPEKYKESIDVLIKDISEAKNLDPQKAAEATRILNELKEGAFGKRFLESMPQRDKMIQKVLSEEVEGLTAKIKQAVKGGTEKELVEDVITDISKRITNLSPNEKQVLVDMIRVELGNSISAMRERILGNFISKEIYQKYSLKHTIEELEEMSDKSIAEIREYLSASAKKAQTVPADIKRLKDQARAARKVLTDKLKEEEAAAYNEFVVQFLKSLSKMDAFGMEEMGTFELLLRTGEKFRLNAMLASIRTWTVGFLSASFNMGYLPFKQMLKKYNEIKIRQAQGDAVYGPEVSAMKLALQELKATSEYFNNWGDMFTILKATWKQNGHGAFNAKAFRRHEEDLIQKTAKQETEALKKGPIKLNFKNKDQLQRMVNKYGVDSDRNRGLLRKFLEETVEGEPTTAVGKMLDPLFSVSFRVMGLFDQPFVFMGTMRALRSEAMQEGLLKGLEGKALDQFAKKRMSEALKRDGDVLTWAQNEEFHEASELGFAMVYQQEYADKVISRLARDFSRWSRSSEDAYRDPIKIVSRLLVPFIKTPTAIAQWTVDNLPVLAHYNWAKATLGSTRSAKKLKEVEQTILKNTEALKSDVIPKEEIKKIEDANEVLFEQRNELILKKAEEQAEAAANGISSTVLGAGIMTGIATGNITGSGAHLSDDQRARLREAGWRPNTLYIGGHKIDYSRFEPFSTMMSVHADLIHYLMLSGEELTPDDQEWYNVLHASFVTNFSDKYFLRGLKSVFSLLDYKPGNYAMESAAVDFLSSFSPSLLRDLNQVNQEFQTRANSFKDKLLERSAGVFPGLYARNLLGEKVERQWQREGAWGVLSPVYFAEDKRDKLMTELASIREDVGGRYSFNKTEKEKIDTREFKNPKTKLSLYDEWMDEMSKVRLGGKTLRRSLESLIKTQRYKKAPNFEVSGVEDTKAKLVREKLKQYRDRAWIEIRKDRKIRKYQNAQGEAWFDVITGKLLEPNRRTTASDDIVDISLPKQ